MLYSNDKTHRPLPWATKGQTNASVILNFPRDNHYRFVLSIVVSIGSSLPCDRQMTSLFCWIDFRAFSSIDIRDKVGNTKALLRQASCCLAADFHYVSQSCNQCVSPKTTTHRGFISRSHIYLSMRDWCSKLIFSYVIWRPIEKAAIFWHLIFIIYFDKVPKRLWPNCSTQIFYFRSYLIQQLI